MATPVHEGWAWTKDYCTALKHGSLKPYSKTEREVRAATRHTLTWGPTGAELASVAELTYTPRDCATVLAVLEMRMGYPPKKWRAVFKALSVLEFVLKRGSDDAVGRACQQFPSHLQQLARFSFISPDGRDHGQNVRLRAQAVLALLQDERRLAAEREAHQAKRAVLNTGFSSAAAGAPAQQQGAYGGAGAGGWTQAADGGHLSPKADAAGQGAQEAWLADPAAALPNAGETKGVSMEQNSRHLGALKRLLDLPANRACADCGGSGSAQPSWASVNCGVFICMRCAGAHRSLGVHVSQVRSCTLDTWLPEQVVLMARCGNRAAAAYWEVHLPPGGRPWVGASLTELEGFARRKYLDRQYVDTDGQWSHKYLDRQYVDTDGQWPHKYLDRQYVDTDGQWPPAKGGLRDPEVLRILQEFQIPHTAPAAAAPPPPKEAPAPPAPPAAPLINLMDDDFGPPAAAAAAGDSSTQPAAPSDPLASLQDAFSSSSSVQQRQAPGLGSWDMGAQLAMAQEAEEASETEAAETESAASSAADSVVAPQQNGVAAKQPQPAYRPPWAPQPQQPWQAQCMQLTPAAAAFDAGFQSLPAPHAYPYPAPASTMTNGFASAAQPASGDTTAPSLPAPTPAQPPRPESPRSARIRSMMLQGLASFDLHSETVSGHKPVLAQPPSGPAPLSMAAMRAQGTSAPLGTLALPAPPTTPQPSEQLVAAPRAF